MAKYKSDQPLTLESLISEQNVTTSHVVCRDYFGNEISIGDYIVGISGIPKCENREGIVVDIIEYDYGIFIKLQTLGGRIVAYSDYPCNYAIKKQ